LGEGAGRGFGDLNASRARFADFSLSFSTPKEYGGVGKKHGCKNVTKMSKIVKAYQKYQKI